MHKICFKNAQKLKRLYNKSKERAKTQKNIKNIHKKAGKNERIRHHFASLATILKRTNLSFEDFTDFLNSPEALTSFDILSRGHSNMVTYCLSGDPVTADRQI